ncbi:MAG: FeoB-associated Cys-rich membrane protein [Proteobacteria bacterium]|nr:FeoB-associated Cys-rich membrane protein [Pseudomonadota bacterium]MBU1716349.1 FeoB-associated Cys-rich membrane protein [Pseudomonadota bacterium]
METYLLWLIIGTAAFFCGRSLYRTMTGKNKGCGCSTSCDTCSPNITPIESIKRLTPEKPGNKSGKNN